MADATFGKWRVIGGGRYEMSGAVGHDVQPLRHSQRRGVDPGEQRRPAVAQRRLRDRAADEPPCRVRPFAIARSSAGSARFRIHGSRRRRSVAGNPELEQATIDGLDLRWEMFPRAGEVVAASVFTKKIDKPIERIVQPTSDYRQSFVNADQADLWGVELEFRARSTISPRAALLVGELERHVPVDSKVTVGEHQLSVVTNAERSLEGDPDAVGNLALQFYHPSWGTMFRVLGSYTGERLADVGGRGLPDTFEQPFTSFDVVISQSFGELARGLELKLAAKNLLGEARVHAGPRDPARHRSRPQGQFEFQLHAVLVGLVSSSGFLEFLGFLGSPQPEEPEERGTRGTHYSSAQQPQEESNS
jgi:outer membrane receptor protein involved in Fe transport